ncbi:MAG: rhomboid family intramembrane serine protease [Lachnospiraceae bacterium]|nr:rhomboid family intramembrane serine protease [Ruminococcus sp.]MCM1276106.1 rhomboid family intramembrane serine protease [Lachnospiraceae bacterium]
MNNKKLKLSYNSPVILTFAAACLVTLILDWITKGFTNRLLFVCYGHASLLDPLTYLRAFSYVFGHANFSHFAGNMTMLLLVGPIVEERYGSWNLCIMMGVTALAGGILNMLFFSTGILGASGIVFMLIILSAFTNMKKGEIPLTLILIAVIYLGQEIYSGITVNDNVSHFGHICGGVSGLGFGAWFYKKKFEMMR